MRCGVGSDENERGCRPRPRFRARFRRRLAEADRACAALSVRSPLDLPGQTIVPIDQLVQMPFDPRRRRVLHQRARAQPRRPGSIRRAPAFAPTPPDLPAAATVRGSPCGAVPQQSGRTEYARYRHRSSAATNNANPEAGMDGRTIAARPAPGARCKRPRARQRQFRSSHRPRPATPPCRSRSGRQISPARHPFEANGDDRQVADRHRPVLRVTRARSSSCARPCSAPPSRISARPRTMTQPSRVQSSS